MDGWGRVKQVAKYTNVSERTLRFWLKNGLKSSKIGGIVLVKFSDLDEFIEGFQVKSSIDLIVGDLEKSFNK